MIRSLLQRSSRYSVQWETIVHEFQLLVGRLRITLVSLHTQEGRRSLWHRTFPVLGFAAAYLAAYVYGNGLPSPAPLWPPDAILLSALLLVPPRRWWIYLLITIPIRMLPALAPGSSDLAAHRQLAQ